MDNISLLFPLKMDWNQISKFIIWYFVEGLNILRKMGTEIGTYVSNIYKK